MKSCPFCGCKAEVLEVAEKDYMVFCRDCRCQTPYRSSIDEVERLWNSRSEWVSVKDKLPNEFEEVMFFYVMHMNQSLTPRKEIGKRDIVCGHYANGIWHICYLYTSLPLRNDIDIEVTHWLPLPDYPI